LHKKPKNILLRLIRQEIAYNSPDYDEKDLIEINKKDLEIFPEDPNLMHFKGLILWNLDEHDRAIRYIDQALDLDKDNVDFLRNKALVYIHKNEFNEARKVIQRAFGLEPNYAPLKETDREIDRTELEEEFREEVYDISDKIDGPENAIKNIKFEFIQIFALFVVILTVVVKVVSFDYENFRSISFLDIILYQLAINFSWLFALVLILVLIIVLHIRRNN
jgi:tetratricopeptide (TPR) repeat protein